MDVSPLLASLQETRLATGIRDSLLLFPLLESLHVIGLALVVGTIAVVDLRLLGLASAGRPFRRMTSEILKWTWGAFVLTALTGSLMFVTNAEVYFHNAWFRAKLVLLALAGANVLVFELTAGRTSERWDRAPSAPPVAKAVAAVSLVLWVAVIAAGRMIGFTTSRATLADPLPAAVDFEDLIGVPAAGEDATAAPGREK